MQCFKDLENQEKCLLFNENKECLECENSQLITVNNHTLCLLNNIKYCEIFENQINPNFYQLCRKCEENF